MATAVDCEEQIGEGGIATESALKTDPRKWHGHETGAKEARQEAEAQGPGIEAMVCGPAMSSRSLAPASGAHVACNTSTTVASSPNSVTAAVARDHVGKDADTGDGSASKRARLTNSAAADATKQKRGRGLHPEGEKVVEGFEACGLWVAANCGKKLPKTQSWCFVPLIFSALGCVPELLRQEGASTAEQILEAQPIWSKLFSHWPMWRAELKSVIEAYDVRRFELDFLPKASGQGSWTTSLVYGEPRVFGRLPHPAGPKQDRILGMLSQDTQNQIFASVMALTSS